MPLLRVSLPALFAAVQAQNASLLKLFEESAKRESQLADRLSKLEKEGDSDAEKEAQSREFVRPFAENDYYVGAAEHLIRKAGQEPSFDKRNWSHIAAVKSLEDTRARLESSGKLLTVDGIAAGTSLEHLLTLVAMVTTECAILGMAVERRHKLLSFLGMAGEERHKALLVLVFNTPFA